MKKEEPILTIFTPTYNQEKYVRKCLDSIVKQETKYKFQVVVSDDCSTDNTRKIIDEYQKKYPNIIKPIYREKNLGPMDNFCQTLNRIHTKYVALCDGDDFWTDKNKIQLQVDYLESHFETSICCHKTKIFFEDHSQKESVYPKLKKENLTMEDLLNENFIVANTVMYRWKYLEEDSFIKEFPSNIVPGDYFVHLMHAKNGNIHFINRIMSNYRRQPSGMWYLSSNPNMQNEFFLKYGKKFLNFFNAVDKKLNLNNDVLREKRDWIIRGCFVAYYKEKKYSRVIPIFLSNYAKDKKTFNSIIKYYFSR